MKREQTLVDQLIDYFDGQQSSVAEALSVSTQAVSKWKVRGRIPSSRALQVQAVTGGKLSAERILWENSHARA